MKNKNNSKQNFYPACLTIAESDSSGGAGIQADLRTFNAFAVYGCSAITAVSAGNPKKVSQVQAVESTVIGAQIDAVLSEIPIKFTKSGMLLNAETVKEVAEKVKKYNLKLIFNSPIVDITPSVIETIKKELLPIAEVVILSIKEVEILLETKISNEKELFQSAEKLNRLFKTNLILSGGISQNNTENIDIVVLADGTYRLKSPFLKNCRHTHGADSTFSAALCASLALGVPLDDSILDAKTFVFGSLAEPVRIGDTCEVMYPPELDYSEHISLIGI